MDKENEKEQQHNDVETSFISTNNKNNATTSSTNNPNSTILSTSDQNI